MAKSAGIAVALAGLAAAQLNQLPPCARDCVSNYTTGSEIAGCDALDAACICANPNFIGSITCCLTDACDEGDIQQSLEFAIDFCNTQGVQVPTEAVCSTATAASTGVPTSTAAATGSPSATASAESPSDPTRNAGPRGESGPGTGLLGGLLAVLALL